MDRGRSLSQVARTLIGLLCLAAGTAHAARYTFNDRADGISCHYFDVALGVTWPNDHPDGADADGRPEGPHPYASHVIEAGDTRPVVRMDVSALVRDWWSGRLLNDGLLVRMLEGSDLAFHAREDPDFTLRPQLLFRYANGVRRYLEPQADAALDCSSLAGLGTRPTLLLKGSSALALRFDFTAVADLGVPSSAELVLVRTGDASSPVRSVLVVQRLVSPIGVAGTPRLDGIARRYPADAGISADPDVLFADGFDSLWLDRRWTRGMTAPSERVEHDAKHHFEPLAGPALRVKIPKGRQVGLDLRYRFKDNTGREPDEIYFRYYLRLAADWLRAGQGGKMPGLAGTYGLAAWGDRPWDGYKGWSLRGAYAMPPPPGHPAHGRVMLGTYAYHSKTDPGGQLVSWPGSALAALVEPDRWYCIEQRVRLNTPGREDGILQVWVDGRPVLDQTNLRLRDAPDIHIQEVWMNFFHGGGTAAPVDMHAYIDEVVVARRYIGPMGR